MKIRDAMFLVIGGLLVISGMVLNTLISGDADAQTKATKEIADEILAKYNREIELARLLRENSRQFNSFVAFSVDERENWSEPIELPAALTGDRHMCRYTKDGRLVIVFRDTTRDSPTDGDWVVWIGRYHDIADGEEGQYRVRLMDNKKGSDCCYPGVECLPDGTIVTTTYGHWIENESPFIVSVRFKLEEIDDLAGIS